MSVAGCSVGMMDKEGEKPLAKQWRIESTSAELLVALAPYKCSGGHEHGEALGSGRLWRTASYTPFPWPPASSDEARSSSRRFAISAATKSMVEGDENLVTTKRRPWMVLRHAGRGGALREMRAPRALRSDTV